MPVPLPNNDAGFDLKTLMKEHYKADIPAATPKAYRDTAVEFLEKAIISPAGHSTKRLAENAVDSIIAAANAAGKPSEDPQSKDNTYSAHMALQSIKQRVEKLIGQTNIPVREGQVWVNAVIAALDIIEDETSKCMK